MEVQKTCPKFGFSTTATDQVRPSEPNGSPVNTETSSGLN
jgi:hypothetical protein